MKVLLAAALLLVALPAFPASLFLEELTWTELRDQVRGGKTTILIPIGGTEQNGPHMVLGKHNARARVLAERIAAALGNAIVAPVIAYVPEGAVNPPTGHMRYAGTITIPDDAFEKTLESAARSFAAHGFRDVVFLSDHGGYLNNVKSAADRLNKSWAKGEARAHAPLEYYRAADTDFAKWLKSKGFRDDEIGTHAGLGDTALAMSIDPKLVRERLAGPGDGVSGDARRATAELGAEGARMIVDRTVEALRKALSASRSPVK